MNDTLTAKSVALFALVFAIYFLPAILASTRHHPAANGITAVNLLLGWTVLGWIAALAWALNSTPAILQTAGSPAKDGPRLPCPFCAEAILPAAVTCRFCGQRLPREWSRGGGSPPTRSERAGKALARLLRGK